MITAEAVLVLKAYTKLASSVQGVLVKGARGYELEGTIQRGSELGAHAPQNPVTCLRKATIHSSFADAGSLREGPLVLQGRAVSLADSRVALVGLLLGAGEPEEVLASFDVGDVLGCTGHYEIPFGTVSTTGPLAPPWEYARAILQGRAQRALVACAGGCFLVDRLRTATLSEAKRLFENLCNLDIVVEVPGTERGAVVYRLASNAVALGPVDFEDALAELQASLRVPPSARSRDRLPSTSELQMSASMSDPNLMSDSFVVSPQQVREAAPRSFRVLVQPLLRWQLPVRRLELHVEAATDSPGARQRLLLRPWIAHALQMGVDTFLLVPRFAPARPGDNQRTQKDQLERIVRELAEARLISFDGNSALTIFAREMARALNAAFNESGLFPAPVMTGIRTSLETTHGSHVTLASGGVAVVPEYATRASTARMCALTGPLIAAGLRVVYTPWSRARNGIPVI